MKPNVNMVSVAALSVLLAGCQTTTSEPVERSDKAMEKQVVTVTEIEPDDQLYKALKDFAGNENTRCAAEIREAAKSVRAIASSATEKRRSAIDKAAESLERLAAKVEKNEVKDLASLYKSFGKTGRALAANRLSLSETEYFKHSEQNSGNVLANTIDQLEQSMSSHHRALTAQEKQIFHDAHEVAERLQKGDKVDEDDFKSALQSIDLEIEKWNKEFERL